MPELFDTMDASAFAMPGDMEALGRLPEPDPEAEAEQQDGRPRDDQGRFVSNAAVPDTEAAVDDPAADEVPAEAEAEPETPADKLLAGNFKSVDELERAYEELRSLNGRQSSELGELRKAFEDRFASVEQQLRQPAPQQVQITPDLIMENPALATQLAVEQQNVAAAQAAFEQWKAEDPAAAGAWIATKQAEERIAAERAALEERIVQLEGRLAPAEEAAKARQAEQTFAPEFQKNPQLAEFVNSQAIQDLAKEFPDTGQFILSGSPEQQLRAVITLFEVHKGRASDNLKVAQEEVARATAEAAQQAREDAFVASTTVNSTGEKPSVADQIAAEWDQILQTRDAGWNIK